MRAWTLRTGWALMVMASLSTGCARNTVGTATAPGGSEVLRADEIRRSGAADVLQAIRILRPAFLQTRGRTSILRSEETEPAVYLDERPFGGVRLLADIPANTVLEVRHFNAAQAQMKYGAGHSQGAILVITGAPR